MTEGKITTKILGVYDYFIQPFFFPPLKTIIITIIIYDYNGLKKGGNSLNLKIIINVYKRWPWDE